MSSFNSSEYVQKKEGGPNCTVSNNKFSVVSLNKVAIFQQGSQSKDSKWGPNIGNLFKIPGSKPIIFSDISEYFR